MGGYGLWCPALHLWIADQVRNDVTMLCIVFTLTLALSHQGRGGFWSVVLSCCHPRHTPPLWIADQVRNDVTMLVHRFHPHPSPLPSRGGIVSVVLACCMPHPVDTALKPV